MKSQLMAVDNQPVRGQIRSVHAGAVWPYTAYMLLHARDFVIHAGLGQLQLALAEHRVACEKTVAQFNRGTLCRIACRLRCNTHKRVSRRCAAIQGWQNTDSQCHMRTAPELTAPAHSTHKAVRLSQQLHSRECCDMRQCSIYPRL